MRGRDLIHHDLVLRAAGLALLVLGDLAGHRLYLLAQAARGQDVPPTAMLWGALSFVAITLGAVLALLGAHIHDRVRTSARWRAQDRPRRRR